MRGLVAILAAIAPAALAVSPIVKLPYATYEGVANGNVTEWLGMHYAAPPTGNLRFAEPQPPLAQSGIVPANKSGLTCYGVGTGTPSTQGEDCLVMNVYAPSAATSTSKLPVFLWIQGGGWATDADPSVNGTNFVKSSGYNVITAFINYRVGALGFLGGSQFANNTSGTALNNGMRDQIAALAWIRDNIASFGGDPTRVTVGGSSAGAGSVMQLLTAYGGTNTTFNSLFHAVAGESPFQPTLFSANGSQFMYNDFVSTSKCNKTTDELTIACLRNLTAAQVQAANKDYPLPGAPDGPANYVYGPTWDTELWPEDPYALLAAGKFYAVPAIFGDDANGGSIFVPKTLANETQFDDFMLDNYPALTSSDVQQMNTLYTPANVQHLPPPNATGFGAYYSVAAQAYGDATFSCPAQLISDKLSGAGKSVYAYLFNATTQSEVNGGIGASHVSEEVCVFGSFTNVDELLFPSILVDDIMGYWTSFVRTVGNVNTYRYSGASAWPTWNSSSKAWIEFENGDSNPGVAVPSAPSALFQQRCAFWEGIGAALGQ